MTKQYTTPNLKVLKLQLGNMIAASIPVSGETDDEARSKAFWGETLFDEPDEEETSFF